MTEKQKQVVAYFMANRQYFNFNNIEKNLNLYQGFFHFLAKKYDANPQSYKVKQAASESLERFYNELIGQNQL